MAIDFSGIIGLKKPVKTGSLNAGNQPHLQFIPYSTIDFPFHIEP